MGADRDWTGGRGGLAGDVNDRPTDSAFSGKTRIILIKPKDLISSYPVIAVKTCVVTKLFVCIEIHRENNQRLDFFSRIVGPAIELERSNFMMWIQGGGMSVKLNTSNIYVEMMLLFRIN